MTLPPEVIIISETAEWAGAIEKLDRGEICVNQFKLFVIARTLETLPEQIVLTVFDCDKESIVQRLRLAESGMAATSRAN